MFRLKTKTLDFTGMVENQRKVWKITDASVFEKVWKKYRRNTHSRKDMGVIMEEKGIEENLDPNVLEVVVSNQNN